MIPRNLLAEWSRLIIDGIAAAGVRRVVLSPGSRSTALALAAAEHQALRVTTIVDERSAAFFALGWGRATGEPALLLCTSGTAPAHYAPAVAEASVSYIPLVVLSADRPFELSDCGAPQTIDQIHLFGAQVRGFFELGNPEPGAEALRGVQRRAAQAVVRSRAPVPGPVHLNVRARKPLEPPAAGFAASAEEQALADTGAALRRGLGRLFAPDVLPSAQGVEAVRSALERARRPLLVAGALPPALARRVAPLVSRLAEQCGLVLAPDLASGLRRPAVSAWMPILDVPTLRARVLAAPLRPDFVLQLGPPPMAAGWPAFVRALMSPPLSPPTSTPSAPVRTPPPASFYVLGGWGAYDPGADATGVVLGSIEDALARLVSATRGRRAASPEWQEAWCALDRQVRFALDEVIESNGERPSEADAARCLVRSLAPGDLLALGNSLPIRLAETWAGDRGGGLTVLTQRGANGIDGLVSQFAGCLTALERDTAAPHAASPQTASPQTAALQTASPQTASPQTASPQTAALLLGDLSLLHDLTGLQLLARLTGCAGLNGCARPSPVRTRVVVLNNHGGRIFEQLPIAEAVGADAPAMELFTTPHQLDFRAAAEQFGLGYVVAATRSELAAALRSRTRGALLIEVPVGPHQAAEEARRVAAALCSCAPALAPSGGP